MRMRFAALVALLTVIAAAPAAAQRTSVGGSYDWSLPMGDLDKYTGNDSWLGFTVDIRSRGSSDKVTFGGLLGYYEFYDPTISGTTAVPRGAISGQQYHHMFSLPIMLSATLYGGSAQYHRPRPFIGLNAGVTYLKQTSDIGIYSFISDAWVVSAMPEIGLALPTSGRTQMNLHVRYHIPFSSTSLFSGGTSGASMQYLAIGVGFNDRMF
jgi:hypothetical protein